MSGYWKSAKVPANDSVSIADIVRQLKQELAEARWEPTINAHHEDAVRRMSERISFLESLIP